MGDDDRASAAGGKGGTPSDGQPPSYEQARDELTAIVARLEGGEASLEESISLWERGEQLATICQDWLAGARRTLAKATGEAEGSASPAPPD
jgi:exodeoxyribonuclease VII small subunit